MKKRSLKINNKFPKKEKMRMSELKKKKKGTIVELNADEGMKERFLSLGMREGTEVKCLFSAFHGDPIAFEICGCTIALRKKDIKGISVFLLEEEKKEQYRILLAGNPNVGKSTLFNYMTGLHQHTGNWTGKTVEMARGICKQGEVFYEIYDLPGTYSLCSRSEEEKVAEQYLREETYDAVIVVCDAGSLKRNLILALEIMEITKNVVLCINLLDEAKKKGIVVDLKKLEQEMGVPVRGCTARTGEGVKELFMACKQAKKEKQEELLQQGEQEIAICTIDKKGEGEKKEEENFDIIRRAEEVANCVVTNTKAEYQKKERFLDSLLTKKSTGIPIMLFLLFGVFWLTIKGANGPSAMLALGFEKLGMELERIFLEIHMPVWVQGLLLNGVYKVTSFVISVMLPPMAIFFPLFTILEDYGYLPRIAFNLDHLFSKCHACGKQALTMCMGFGCSAVGVTGCRIIDSPRERLIAVLTNCFVPCNGKFPTLVAMISVGMLFLGVKESFLSALLLMGAILLGVFMTFLMSFLLSVTILKGEPSAFTLELPPYRRPQFLKVIVRSFLDRTLFVLGRAMMTAMPAGVILWVASQIKWDGVAITIRFAQFLEPMGNAMGLDGVILSAFLFGFPANEIIVPIMLMLYSTSGTLVEFGQISGLQQMLLGAGWTIETIVCMCVFMLFHWPCSTTLLTIKKETNSVKWTLIAFLLPTAVGIILCCFLHFLFAWKA